MHRWSYDKTAIHMPLKKGQKVVCINNSNRSFCRYPLRKGSIYTIHGFYKCPCGSRQVTLTEIPASTIMGCSCHRTSLRMHSYFSWRFKPLEYYEIYKDLLLDINLPSKEDRRKYLELQDEVKWQIDVY